MHLFSSSRVAPAPEVRLPTIPSEYIQHLCRAARQLLDCLLNLRPEHVSVNLSIGSSHQAAASAPEVLLRRYERSLPFPLEIGLPYKPRLSWQAYSHRKPFRETFSHKSRQFPVAAAEQAELVSEPWSDTPGSLALRTGLGAVFCIRIARPIQDLKEPSAGEART